MRFIVLSFLSLLHLSVSSTIPSRPRSNDLSIPLTKRTPVTDDDGVANIQAIANQLTRVESKINRGFRAYYNNTGSFHPSDSQRATKRDTGSIPLTDENGGQLWQGTISVGTPPVEFTVDFDTGSSDTFLPGPLCIINCVGHKQYNPLSSSTSKPTGQGFQLAYGDGSTVTGGVHTDTVTIAGLTATGQAVGAALTYSDGFDKSQFPPDGLMGMAFQEISQFKASPVFQTMVSEGATSEPQFSFKLATSGSELFLGGVNTHLFTGSITEVPVTQKGFWQVNLDSINADGKKIASGLSAVIDTGTTLILGDADTVATIYAGIPGSQINHDGTYSFPCNADPKISLTFGGRTFTVSAQTFNLGQMQQGSPNCLGGIGVIPKGVPASLWIVGDVFLQNVYTVFNTGDITVGFASLA